MIFFDNKTPKTEVLFGLISNLYLWNSLLKNMSKNSVLPSQFIEKYFFFYKRNTTLKKKIETDIEADVFSFRSNVYQ